MQVYVKPAMRGHLHQAAFYSSLGAGLMLIAVAHTHIGRLAALIYVVTLSGLFGAIALYHRPRWGDNARQWLRRIDHSSIYLLIAGSATPVFLLGMSQGSGTRLLWTIWVVALFGALKCFFWPTAPRLLNVILYIGAGFIALPYLSEIYEGLGGLGVFLLLLGGVIYSAGAFVYCFKKPNPFPKTFGYHEIFHAMVIIASACHFKVIYDLVQTH